MTSLAIETHGLGKRFGARAALESIDLEVVEKTCDSAAIVDNGRVVAQGTIEQLTELSDERTIDIVAAPAVKAAHILASIPAIHRAVEHDSDIRATLAPGAPRDADVVTVLLRRLLAEDIAVERVIPVKRSLEDQRRSWWRSRRPSATSPTCSASSACATACRP